MIQSKIEALLLLVLALIKDKHAQPTAVITPRGYNASLDPDASFIFQCDVTGADDVQWLVDGVSPSRQEIINRGILVENAVIIVNEVTGSFRQNISITRNDANKNTTLVCIADSFTLNDIRSDPVLFQVQGLLKAPPNIMLSEADDHYMRRLSWNDPFSPDITDLDPDINHYKICYTLVDVNKSQCTLVNQTEFTFLNVNVPLLFTVSAVNVVGEGNASSILHNGSGCFITGLISQ